MERSRAGHGQETLLTLQELRQKIEQKKGALGSLKESRAAVEKTLGELRQEALDIDEGLMIIQHVARETQAQLGIYLDDMVTMGIEGVFPDDLDYKFKADFVPRRGQTEVDLMLADEKGNRIRPSDQDGGGLVDVVAFVLRVALWCLRKASRPVIILDEPFRNLHGKEDQRRVAQLVRTLSDRLGLQFIIITGEDESPELLSGADRVIRVGKVRGVSRISYDKPTAASP